MPLQDVLAERPDLSGRRVVCMADLFVDHFVHAGDTERFGREVADLAAEGGGNLPGVPQTLAPGGQAANVARHLAGLGVDAALLAPTGPVGRLLANHWLGTAGVDLDPLIDAGTSLTVAVEDGANVMVNDAASLADLTWDDVDPGLLEGADGVVMANWAQIGDGDAFVEALLAWAQDRDVPVLVDPGDPRRRTGDHRLDEVLAAHPPDVVAVNEAEADAFGWPGALPCPVLVHTEDDATLHRPSRDPVTVPSLDVDPVRRTGAGDAFHAGVVVGRMLDLDDADVLRLAHAVAAAAITADRWVVGWGDVRRVLEW